MKNNFSKLIMLPKYILLIFLATTISCWQNDDDDPPTEPVDQLPPATQTGAGTFGCLLDGEVYLPGNIPNKMDCVYQYVNSGYYLSLQGSKRDSNNNIIRISLNTKRKEIQQNETYNLLENIDENAYGSYFYNLNFSYTSLVHSGELTITKLDFDNHIVSGTFWFDVKDSAGVVHEIRDGRFDMRFTE
ncbi:DUF6252 family protein [Aequorivita capsosiphonis]|uniref:DUF6252 family protein n=1 Tax=Aequorivita capsosiphonis TaxID=487317 RepID=UPI00047A2247|nr:DUF6252 family protein [Aequorivita capsosiphonis]